MVVQQHLNLSSSTSGWKAEIGDIWSLMIVTSMHSRKNNYVSFVYEPFVADYTSNTICILIVPPGVTGEPFTNKNNAYIKECVICSSPVELTTFVLRGTTPTDVATR
jgi:hypothetical protein